MKATISRKLFTLVFASLFLPGVCVQAAAPGEDTDEATFTRVGADSRFVRVCNFCPGMIAPETRYTPWPHAV